MEVADLFLRDGGERIDRVVPLIEGGLRGELREAGRLELLVVLDIAQLLDEELALGQHLCVAFAEVAHVSVEVRQELLVARAEGRVGDRPQRPQQEVARVET